LGPLCRQLNKIMDVVSTKIWMILTQFGAASAILPMVPAVMLGLWREGRRNVIITWALLLIVAIAIVLISKLAFLGWGLGIARLDFTGVSGHTMLATAILPVVFAWLPLPRHWSAVAIVMALVLVVLVGWSRLALGAHSLSEVLGGWMLGASVSAAALMAMRRTQPVTAVMPTQHWPIVMVLVLILGVNQPMAKALPLHPWVERLALTISGHDHIFRRSDLRARIAKHSAEFSPRPASPHSANDETCRHAKYACAFGCTVSSANTSATVAGSIRPSADIGDFSPKQPFAALSSRHDSNAS
jgi:membrane-associated phospholipid phosphatase